MTDSLVEEMKLYAPVLERVVDLVLKNKFLKYGDALESAIKELSIEVPEQVQEAILMAAVRISVSGFQTNFEA